MAIGEKAPEEVLLVHFARCLFHTIQNMDSLVLVVLINGADHADMLTLNCSAQVMPERSQGS